MRILIVNNGNEFDQRLSQILKVNGYASDTALDVENGIEMALTKIYDVIIIEETTSVNLQGEPSMLEVIRANKLDTPILILVANNAPKERADALDAGADDCLSRPFSEEEFAARIRALTRRKNKELVDSVIVIKGLTLDLLRREIRNGNTVYRLSNKEALILELLMRNYGNVVTKETIYFKVWGLNSETSIANVDLFIHYLRKKLGSHLIKTIRNTGYLLQPV
ncbi:response regulator with CheY-like receiver domain and winged-helix DNA-binding domain [Desulfosporosinus acidiphilus SJ4]|uniref:Stage 0 sporulation protein A homolog n=1 Tax=Desulfosporosinus acidiphilus (strain DSM 22704 / JCM 16185 / SJ4) TaxID=646529 RepID=I4D7I9_DESAJ|nr:response regulator with CheY-like receiver domain and winged-helix DNA-binding domain [Desulfosporosinus acidiphilus SJ4]